MKRFLIISVLFLSGCVHSGIVTTPIPGAVNQFDSDTYQTLATAHAFVESIKLNSKTLSANEKAIVNQLIVDLNAADALYSAYHTAGAPTSQQSAVQTAVAKVQGDQQVAINSGVK